MEEIDVLRVRVIFLERQVAEMSASNAALAVRNSELAAALRKHEPKSPLLCKDGIPYVRKAARR